MEDSPNIELVHKATFLLSDYLVPRPWLTYPDGVQFRQRIEDTGTKTIKGYQRREPVSQNINLCTLTIVDRGEIWEGIFIEGETVKKES
jgi:hypothetical protein